MERRKVALRIVGSVSSSSGDLTRSACHPPGFAARRAGRQSQGGMKGERRPALTISNREIRQMAINQYQIEKAAGIDQSIARHMMARKTPAACNAMGLLQMQVACYDSAGFALLQEAVKECRKEITTSG